jgi:hypothetical protein
MVAWSVILLFDDQRIFSMKADDGHFEFLISGQRSGSNALNTRCSLKLPILIDTARKALVGVYVLVVSACMLMGMPIDYTVLTQGDASGAEPSPPVEAAARSPTEARAALGKIGSGSWADPQARLYTDKNDYTNNIILIVSPGPQSGAGFDIRIDDLREEDQRLVVYYSRQIPYSSGAIVTTPFLIARIKRTEKPVVFVRKR